MRYAILSDVHANVEALTAVLADARALGATRVVCLGDFVGYYADPEACVALLREGGALAVAGNHDLVAASVTEPHDFGAVAERAALWTRGRLSSSDRTYLAALPLCRVVDDRFLAVHAALHPAPNADLHLSSAARVRRSIQALVDQPHGVRVAFFGHTHRSVVVEARGDHIRAEVPLEGDALHLAADTAYLVNPGSVGQPRDGDARASYAVFDTDAGTIQLRRLPFDADACLDKAARAGLLGEPRGPVGRFIEALGRRLA